MSDRALLALQIAAPLFIGLAVTTWILIAGIAFFNSLKQHKEIWQSWGELVARASFSKAQFIATWHFAVFVMTRRYRRLDDQQLSRMGDRLFVVAWLFFGTMLVLAVLDWVHDLGLLGQWEW